MSEDSKHLEGQIALVTGASRGIGRAIAIELGRRGARIFVNYRSNEAAARETVDAARAAGAPNAQALRADVGVEVEADGLVRSVFERTEGRLDILVNNAGIQHSAMLHKMGTEDWRATFATNLDAVFFLCRAALPAMREAKRGHVVNVASASSYLAEPGAAAYAASKHALIGLTKSLALENARKGVLVNAVAPGLTETDMLAELDEKQRAALLARVPLGRIARPEEVAGIVAWVVSEGSYSTGNVFHVTGGITMG